jgi:hypothetical protein
MLHLKKSNWLNRTSFLSWIVAAFISIYAIYLNAITNPNIIVVCGLANIMHFIPVFNVLSLILAASVIYYI